MKRLHLAGLGLAAAVFTFSCAGGGAAGYRLRVAVEQLDAAYADTLLLSTGKSVVGIDPVSLERRIKLNFDTYVTCGDGDADGNLYLGDQGRRVGDFGGHLFVLDARGRLAKTVEALPSPSFVTVIGDRVYADSNVYFADAYAGFNVFDRRTMAPVLRDERIAGFAAASVPFARGALVYYGVTALNGRPGRFYAFDPRDGALGERFDFNKRYPLAICNYLASGATLFLVHNFVQTIEAFDLDTGRSLAFLNLHAAIPELRDDPDYVEDTTKALPRYLISAPKLAGGKLYVFAAVGSVGQGAALQSLVQIDPATLTVERILPLAPETTVSGCDLKFVTANYAFLYNIGRLYVFDLADGSLRKTISLD